VSAKQASSVKSVPQQLRTETRIHGLRHIRVSYEGRHEQIVVRPPDLSPHGMFISTTRVFPEGAVLNLCFQLEQSGAEIETRSEVRYCLPGVGVGVEFIGISPKAQREIAREIERQTKPSKKSK
jgi:hypothetical protein